MIFGVQQFILLTLLFFQIKFNKRNTATKDPLDIRISIINAQNIKGSLPFMFSPGMWQFALLTRNTKS